MKTVEQYRSYARDCRRLATNASDIEKQALRQIADAWEALADRREAQIRGDTLGR